MCGNPGLRSTVSEFQLATLRPGTHRHTHTRARAWLHYAQEFNVQAVAEKVEHTIRYDTIRYDTRDAISTCAQKLTPTSQLNLPP